MGYDILSSLPPEQAKAIREKVAAETVEMRRLYALPDRWLGEAVLAMARKVREVHPDLGTPDPPHGCYEACLVWQVVPRLAKLLGCATRYGEATDGDLARMEGPELREYVGTVMGNVSLTRLAEGTEPGPDRVAAETLVHLLVNGNPVVFMLDRVAPPHASSKDWCAKRVREVSRLRGVDVRSAWDPGMDGDGYRSLELDDSGAMVHALPDDDRAAPDASRPAADNDEATPTFGM